MTFHFQLASLESVTTWSSDGNLSLHWFGLTDGWFWVDLGDGAELFHYTDAIREHLATLYPASKPSTLPYEDYQICRYWEDLLDLTPAVLDPLPDDMAAWVADAAAWQRWQDAATQWRQERDDEDGWDNWDTYDQAVRWWSDRTWAAFHLTHPPNIYLWRVGDTVHVRWDNRAIAVDGVPVWEAQAGEIALSVADFVGALRSFDAHFIAAMDERVAAVCAHWSRPEIALDIPALESEQVKRAEMIEYAFRAPAPAYSWDEVRAAMAVIESGAGRG